MEYFKYLRNFTEEGLNEQLSNEEVSACPFCIYEDVGNFDFATRNVNDIISKKYGILTLTSSNIAPLSTLQFAEITAECEIVVNVDEMELEDSENQNSCLEYAPVASTRRAIEEFISKYNAKARFVTDANGTVFSVTPTIEFANAGGFKVATSNLGKIVPLRFSVRCIFIQNGVSSDSVKYTVRYNGEVYELYTIESSETMTTSAEGQTHSGERVSVATVQEAKYGVNLVMPLTNNSLCKKILDILHNGADNSIFPLTVTYDLSGNEGGSVSFEHNVIITTVSLSSNRPRNIGLNISFVDGDTTVGGVVYG